MFSNLDLQASKGRTDLQQCCHALFASVAVILIVSLLLILVLAASFELHQCIHADANHEDHDCAVTLFLSGSFDHPCAGVFVLEPPESEIVTKGVRGASEEFISSQEQQLTSVRGPPTHRFV